MLPLAKMLSQERNHYVITEYLQAQSSLSYKELVTIAEAARYYDKSEYLYTYRNKISDKVLNVTIALAGALTQERNHYVIMDYINAHPKMTREELVRLASAANYCERDYYLNLKK